MGGQILGDLMHLDHVVFCMRSHLQLTPEKGVWHSSSRNSYKLSVLSRNALLTSIICWVGERIGSLNSRAGKHFLVPIGQVFLRCNSIIHAVDFESFHKR